jgi:RND family efflux transporter MFP subunit
MSRSRFATYVIPGVAIVALAGAGYQIASTRTDRPLLQPAITPPSAPKDLAGSIGAVGLVESASEEIGLPATVAGVVARVDVTPGQKVSRGDLLFSIDDRQARADLAVQGAALAAARARLNEAETTLADLNDQLARGDRLVRLSGNIAISEDTLLRRRFAARVAEAKVATARADIESALAQVQAAAIQIDRLAVRAPIDGTVLQVNVRIGEFAPAQILTAPLVVLGQVDPLHIRADIDEADVPRFRPDAKAWASPRGAADRRVALTLVRVEPYVVPKRSLTGSGTERVDTRVLRVIYAFDPKALPAFPGQQMDLFIGL